MSNYQHIKFPDFSQEQLEIINGSLLGDAWLSKFGTHRNSKLLHRQCCKLKNYTKWYYSKMKPFSVSNRKIYSKTRPVCKNGIIEHVKVPKFLVGFETTTHANSIFTKLRRKWYPNDIKTIPDDLNLTPLTIATWFWDDGSNDISTMTATIAAQSFTESEIESLINKLKPFNLYPSIYLKTSSKTKKKQSILKFRKDSYNNLIELIKPFLPHKCLAYKIKWRKAKHRWTTKEEVEKILEMRKTMSAREVADIMKINYVTVYNITNKKTKGAELISK